jgi:hypothetical protein
MITKTVTQRGHEVTVALVLTRWAPLFAKNLRPSADIIRKMTRYRQHRTSFSTAPSLGKRCGSRRIQAPALRLN